jgi:hypothetical protein
MHFDLAKLPDLFPHMPLHTRIGFGPTKGSASVAESMLLDDAFLFLEKARSVHRHLLHRIEHLKKTRPKTPPADMQPLSLNVCSYARISLFTFFSFAECFVNSVGHDFILRTPSASPEDKALLGGKTKKGGFMSLESKIQKFPQVINPALANPITLSDPKQLKEPFLSLLNLVKETRDSIAHHAQGKAPIWLSPQEWIDTADKTARTTLDAAKTFWKACYPEKPYPAYLEGLDVESHSKLAVLRLAAESAGPARPEATVPPPRLCQSASQTC